MDWLTIACLLISVIALGAYLATGEKGPAPRRVERKVQGNHAWAPIAAPAPRPTPQQQVDPEVLDRFVAALKSQSRQAN